MIYAPGIQKIGGSRLRNEYKEVIQKYSLYQVIPKLSLRAKSTGPVPYTKKVFMLMGDYTF